jgi:hemoglobin
MARTGIDDVMIERLVGRFYQRVQADPVLGPIFAERITDWHGHISKLCDFWSSVALMFGRYHGQPMRAHLGLLVGSQHFDRWLSVFERTANELCPPNAARHFVERARRIAESLETGIAVQKQTIQSLRQSAHRETTIGSHLSRDDTVPEAIASIGGHHE